MPRPIELTSHLLERVRELHDINVQRLLDAEHFPKQQLKDDPQTVDSLLEIFRERFPY